MSMERTRQFLVDLGYPGRDLHELPSSTKRFPDGAQYRVEIPSVEGPRALAAVLEEADRYGIQIHRISQGSGIMLQTDAEIRDMLAMARERGMEVSLFTGPRGTWDISAQPFTSSGRSIGARHEGIEQLVYALEDIQRGCELGLRGVLVVDEGLLYLAGEAKKRGFLPPDLVLKVSVQVGAANPVSVRWMEQLGADTYNTPTALTLERLASIRAAVDMPLDIYVEVPDDFGGFVRLYEIPEIIRICAPVYIKFGIRNHPGLYPSGAHVEDLAVKLARERVRRAYLGLQMVQRYCPEAVVSKLGAAGLGIPK
ncbi:MAG TPA: U32 family peptidase [Symbiobacteriaceae bacterium]|jgi:hypothetical protein